MTELIVESINETVIIIDGGPTLTTNVDEAVGTIITEFADPIIVDLNSGPRGEPGAAILVGPHPPSGLVGVMGDMYIVTQGEVLVGQVFRKTGPSTWTDVGNVRGPAGGVNTVNGYTGPDVILDKADVGLGNVTNDAQVTLVGTQTIDGAKTFTIAPAVPDAAFAIIKISGLQAALDSKSTDANVVHLTGPETIAGVKTFSAAPVVPDASFAISKVTNLQTSLDAKEATITAGTTAQYWRGDKSWQTLDKSSVGLGNVDNTSDANKPVSSATQTALNAKEATLAAGTTAQYYRGDKSWQTLNASAVGLGNVANLAQVDLTNAQTVGGIKTFSVSPIVPTPTTATQVANKGYVDTTINAIVDAAPGTLDTLNELAAALGDDPNFATTTANAIATKEPIISAGTTAQYWRGDKTWQTLDKTAVGLANVDNTSDANKPVSSATQTALNLKANLASPTFTGTVAGITATMVGLGNVTNVAQVTLTGNQTVAGIKTFSSTPVFSAGITVTGTATATTFSGSGASLTTLNASNLSSGTVAQARIVQNVVRFVHGATAGTARPTGATYVEWIGSVQPTNMTADDTWINTSSSGNTADLYPTGAVMASGSAKSAAPTNWYWCEGQQILISGDTALYNEITNNASVFPWGANTNGSGAAGSTHFRLPDLRGRVITHVDGTTEFASIGTVFGTKTVSLVLNQMPSHTHAVTDPGHTHVNNDGNDGGLLAQSGATYGIQYSASATGSSTTGITIQYTGGTSQGSAGSAHNNVQPTITMRYMIKR